MNKSELISRIAEKADVSAAAAGRAVDAMVSAVTEALASGQDVTIHNLGSFKVRRRDERNGVNPSTGAAIKIPASNVAKFTPSKALKEAINTPVKKSRKK